MSIRSRHVLLMWEWLARLLATLTVLLLTVPPALSAGTIGSRLPSFGERVTARRAIEEVYWRHRTWPAGDPRAKPALDDLLPVDALSTRVDDDLRKSAALVELWHRPVRSAQLRAEVERMERHSRNRPVLRELFQSLGSDPVLIAECLARPRLVDRMLRNAYAHDVRLHGEVRAEADRALHGAAGPDAMRALGGEYREWVWVRGQSHPERLPVSEQSGASRIGVDTSEWSELLVQLDAALAVGSRTRVAAGDEVLLARLPVGQIGRLVEDAEGFETVAVLEKDHDRIRAASVRWHKRTFDDWWRETREAYSAPSAEARLEPLAGADIAAIAMAVARTEPDRRAAGTETGSGCVDDTWTPIYPGAPERRDYHTGVWTGSEMIVWGGEAPWGGIYQTGGRYDPATDTWAATSNSGAPSQRQQHTAVWTGTEMIVWGGYDGETLYLSSGGRYDPVSDTWRPTSEGPGCPSARYWHTAVWTGSEMIVWGGTGDNYEVDTGGRYDPGTDIWTPTSSAGAPPEARFAQTAVWTGSEMIIWGGVANAPPVWTPGARYDPSLNVWRSMNPTNAPPAGAGHTAVWTGTEVIVWGGDSGQAGGRYAPSSDSWLPLSTYGAPPLRSGHSAVWTGSEMIVWGGDLPWPAGGTNTGGRYFPLYNYWLPTSTGPGTPSGRARHTAVWTGTEMIVWGGYAPETDTSFDTGARYRPTYDDWSPTSTSTGPAGRWDHTAIWTGTEMIVWGGFVWFWEPTSTGSRYDLALDDWTPVAIDDNTPSPRAIHTAVWTGTEMIVWGGFASGSWPADWGRYVVASDDWLPTSPPTSLTPRDGHTAVWTGTEMIVWGGRDSGYQYCNDGARFRPTTGEWTPTVIDSHTPSARAGHTAVWTGSKMIVWGGIGANGTFRRRGGRYSPSQDTWRSTAVDSGTPHARSRHTAVWTGKEMIVWGGSWYRGEAENLVFDSGGRFRPRFNAWTPTVIDSPTPSPRAYHAAVWTGDQMIIWGGTGTHGSVTTGPTGGRYSSDSDLWRATSAGAGVPSTRSLHTAVWTGDQMIVWGGFSITATGGIYCAIATPSTWYHDADGDGYGDPSDTVGARIQPEGYSAYGDDCNDANADISPEGGEVCDGLDNDCDGTVDGPEPGVVSELWLSSEPEGTILSWPPVPHAATQDVVRGGLATLVGSRGDYSVATGQCFAAGTEDESAIDGENPQIADGFWYLVRASNCAGPGTYNSGGAGQSRDRDPLIGASPAACP